MRLRPGIAAPAVVCAAILAAYFGSLSNGFAGDARGLVLEDPRIRDASSENLSNIFQHTYWWPYGESGLYRPATTLSYLVNYSVLGSGKDAAGYHWTNLLLHLLCAGLLYAVARRFVTVYAAAWIAAVWGLHPVLTESVAAISGRPDLIAGACVLGGLVLYWKSVEAEGARRVRWLCALGLVTLIGVLAKESAIVMPAIVLLYAWLWRERRALAGAVAAMGVPVQIMLYLRGGALFGLPPMQFPFWDNPITGAGFWTGRLAALGVMAREFALLVWPVGLSSDYSWGQVRPENLVLPGAAAGIVAAAGLVLLWRRSRVGFFVAMSALLAWLPSSNLLFPIGTIMAERFLYLPAMAFAAGLVWLGGRIPQGRVAAGVLGAVALAYAATTWDRNRVWESDLTLGEAAVRSAPESYKSHKLLANALFESSGTTPRVLEEAEKSLAILNPLPPLDNNADTWRRAASWYMAKGDATSLKRALEILQRCRTITAAQEEHARQDPFAGEDASASGAPAEIDRMIAGIQLRGGNTGSALELLARGVEADPGNAQAWLDYVEALGRAGKRDEAIVAGMEGVLLTVSGDLRERVVGLYRADGGGGCALMPGPNGAMAINPACPPVKQHLCTAAERAIGARVRSGRTDLAEQLKGMARTNFGCGN